MTTGRGATAEICRFIAGLSLDDVPEPVQLRAKYLMLDALACGLVGAKLPWSITAVESMCPLDDGANGTIWGWDRRTSAPSAALLNGTFIQSFELDDYYEHGPLHSGSVVVPSLLSTFELDPGITGERILLAAVVGYEVGPRLGVALDGYELLSKGWHCGPIYGVIASAATAAKARGLGPEGVEDALGIAGTQAAGLMAAQFEAMVKRMHHGFAARNGMMAAGLAAHGYTGIKKVLERDYGGVASTFNPETSDLTRALDGLGSRWFLDGINIKPYAAMAGLHPAIDAALQLRSEHDLHPSDVASVTIEMPLVPYKHGGWTLDRPPTVIGAQMNCAYAFSVALCDGAALVGQYTPERIEASDVWELMGRVTVRHSPEMDEVARASGHKRATRVTVERVDGGSLTMDVIEASGQGTKLLTNADIRDKYRALTSIVMATARSEALEGAVMDLESDGGAAAVLELLRSATDPAF